MAIIKSGESDGLLTVDSTSKAARASVYDSIADASNAVRRDKHPHRVFYWSRSLRFASAGGVNRVNLVVGSTLRWKLRRAEILCGFDGTAAASVSIWRFEIDLGAIVQNVITSAMTELPVGRGSFGLRFPFFYAALSESDLISSTKGMGYSLPFLRVGCQRQLGANQRMSLDDGPIFDPGSVLTMVQQNAAVAGDHLHINLELEEIGNG